MASCKDKDAVCLQEDWVGTYSGEISYRSGGSEIPVTVIVFSQNTDGFSFNYVTNSGDTIITDRTFLSNTCELDQGFMEFPGGGAPSVPFFQYSGNLSGNTLDIEIERLLFNITTTLSIKATKN